MDYLLLEVIRDMGIAMAVGSTAVMIAQWIGANQDKKLSKDETHLLSIVRVVNRVAFLITLAAHILMMSIQALASGGYVSTLNQLILSFLCVVFITITLRNYQIITVRHNLAVQVTTWFSLLILLSLVRVVPIDSQAFLFSYVLFGVFTSFMLDRAFQYASVTHSKPKTTKKEVAK